MLGHSYFIPLAQFLIDNFKEGRCVNDSPDLSLASFAFLYRSFKANQSVYKALSRQWHNLFKNNEAELVKN